MNIPYINPFFECPSTALNRPPWLFLLPLKQFIRKQSEEPYRPRAALLRCAGPAWPRSRPARATCARLPAANPWRPNACRPSQARESAVREACRSQAGVCRSALSAWSASLRSERAWSSLGTAHPPSTRAPRPAPPAERRVGCRKAIHPSIQFSPSSVLQALKCHARSRWAEQAEGSAADQR